MGGRADTHRWQRSPLMPLVVQKHLPLLGLHMPAWPLHLQAEAAARDSKDVMNHSKRRRETEEAWKRLRPDSPPPPPDMHSRWQLPPLVGSP